MRSKWLVPGMRLTLGAVFLYAAYTKLKQEWLVFALSIDAYQLLPSWAVFAVARWLPWVELGVGALLLIGLVLRVVAPLATMLLLGFYGAMLYAYRGGGGIDCGCFGVGEQVSAATLLRDGALLAISIGLSVLVLRQARLQPAEARQ